MKVQDITDQQLEYFKKQLIPAKVIRGSYENVSTDRIIGHLEQCREELVPEINF